MQVQQRDLPDVAGERVRAGVPGPRLVQAPLRRSRNSSPGSRVVLRTPPDSQTSHGSAPRSEAYLSRRASRIRISVGSIGGAD